MNIFPIIPIWLMTIITLLLIIIIIKNNKKNIIDILIIILLFIINLRPMIQNGNATIEDNNLEVLFVIDNTISMNAEDYNGKNKRLDGVKKDCIEIIEALTGAKYSIISFNNSAKVLMPFSKDSTMATETIEIIEPIEELYARGSSLNTPLELLEYTLKNSYEKSNDLKRIVFFISDGEITDDSKLESFSKLKKYIDEGAVLGYGTEKGGNMKEIDRFTEKEDYIYDYTTGLSSKALSKIDEKNLKQIANDLGIDYINMNNKKLNSKLSKISRLKTSNTSTINKKNYDDIYYIFMPPLLILLVIKLNTFRRKAL